MGGRTRWGVVEVVGEMRVRERGGREREREAVDGA